MWVLNLNDINNVTCELLLDLDEDVFTYNHTIDIASQHKYILQNGSDILLLCGNNCVYVQIDPLTLKKKQVL